MSGPSPIVAALLAELDDDSLDQLAQRLAPRLATVTACHGSGDSEALTTAQAARRAGVSTRTVRRALSADTLEGHTVAGRWRIEVQSLDQWLRLGAPTSATPTHANGRRGHGATAGADAIAGLTERAA